MRCYPNPLKPCPFPKWGKLKLLTKNGDYDLSHLNHSERTGLLSSQNGDIEADIEQLETTINEKIKYLAYQEAKFCEIESNREKYKTAEKRFEILKTVRKPICDILLVADLLWFSLNMEMEEIKNILQKISVARYEGENKLCAANLVCDQLFSSFNCF